VGVLSFIGRKAAAERAAQQGFTNQQYHASMQDFDSIVPGYNDGLFFTTPNPEFASQWAGKGKLQSRLGELDAYDRYRPQKQELYESMGSPEYGTPEYDEFARLSGIIYQQEQNAFKTVYPLLARTEKTFDPEKDFDDLADLFTEDRLKAPVSVELPTFADALKSGNYIFYENPEVVQHLKNKGYDSMLLRESTSSKKDREAPYTTVAHFYPERNIRSQFAEFAEGYAGPNIMGGAAGTAALAGLLAAPEEAEAGPKSQAAQEAIQGIMGMIDPRFDPRVRERERLAALTPAVSERGTLDDIPRIALSDLEGRQFITTMSDRTRAGGLLTGINDVEFDLPVNLQGGQDFMFENPGAVWASAPGVVGQIMREAYRSKDNPIYLPYRMAPTGGDFSKMTGEAMISYASANMTQAQKRELNKAIKGYVTKGKMVKQQDGPSKRVGDGLSIEGWQGVDNPASIEAWRNTPDSVRKELMDMMDKQFRNKGGLGIGEARLAVADPYQVGLRDAGIQNVGLIFRDQPVIKESGHPSYPFAVPGEGLGRLDDQPMSIFDLIPNARLGEAQRRVGDTVDPLNPSASDIRAVSMKPYSGRIDEATLRRLEDRGVNVNSPAAVDAALMAMYAEDAHNIEVQNQMKALGLDRDPRYEYGNILPIKQDIVTGESSLAYPEIVRGLLGALIDLGSTPKTGVYNPNAILDIAL